MAYSFRIRFAQSPLYAIGTQESKLRLPVPDEKVSVILKSWSEDKKIWDENKLVVTGSGYETSSAAESDGQLIQNALMVAFARRHIGADFWKTMTNEFVFMEEGLKLLEQIEGRRVLRDIEGLMVFKTINKSEPTPYFISGNGENKISSPPEGIIKDFSKVLNTSPTFSEREIIAYRLLNASMFQSFKDARFLLLIMAIEALSDYAPRSEAATAHVDMLIESTKNSRVLSKEDSDSMIGALRWLKQESIRQAGKRLVAERLGNRMYAEKSATKYFSECYDLRSSLVHSGTLDDEKFNKLAAHLPDFVSDLLTVPILGPRDEEQILQ
ncbi:MAG: hypothetical protein ACTFAL_07120 [Candidatus Electronema sp. V4]|uniref:hypothetical protein n=1 Tax=Candidatus Electronema sp. V4 TaxID=3454756 RepID=UPI004055770D